MHFEEAGSFWEQLSLPLKGSDHMVNAVGQILPSTPSDFICNISVLEKQTGGGMYTVLCLYKNTCKRLLNLLISVVLLLCELHTWPNLSQKYLLGLVASKVWMQLCCISDWDSWCEFWVVRKGGFIWMWISVHSTWVPLQTLWKRTTKVY